MKRRRRGRRTSAQNKGAVAYIVVSYVPLLRGAPGLTMAPQGAAKLLESVSDADCGPIDVEYDSADLDRLLGGPGIPGGR